MKRIIPLCTAFLVLAIVTAVGADRKFEKKFTVKPGGTLRVSTDVGTVMVTGGSSSEVSVVADMRGSVKDIEDFEISATETEGGVEVIGKAEKGKWGFWQFDDLDVRYTIQVPREYSLEVGTSGGDIRLKSVRGAVRAETSGGDVSVGGVEGKIALSTSGGDIRVENSSGSFSAETSGGNIVIASVVGSVEAGTSGGDVRISDVDGRVRAETSGGDVVVSVKGENKGVFAQTSGGDIDITLGKDTRANVDASTSGGSVICNLPLLVSGEIDETEVKGSINGGGDLIFAHTSGGDVRIRATEAK